MRVAAVLLALRGLSGRRQSRSPSPSSGASVLRVSAMTLWSGVLQPWRIRGGSHRVEDLAAFAEPGWVKVAIDLVATPHDAGTLLSTETPLTSDDARVAFGRYWRLV